jgi:hypothetical protein
VSGIVGADADALDGVASQVLATSSALDAMRRSIGSRLNSVHWNGPDADHVRHDWNHFCNSALAHAVTDLQNVAKEIQIEARQQRDTSSAVPHGSQGQRPGPGSRGSTGARGWHTELPSFFNPRDALAFLGLSYAGVKLVDGVLSGFDTLTRAASTTGRYTKNWDKVRYALAGSKDIREVKGVRRVLSDAADFKKSPFLQGLAKNQVAEKLGKLGSSGLVDKAGKVFNLVTYAEDGSKFKGDVQHGDYGDAAAQVSDVASTALMTSKNPVTFLVGANIAIYTDVFKAAGEVRWDEGVPNPLHGDNWSKIWAPSIADAGKQTLKDVLKIF